MICVTHEMGLARAVADRVTLMADGEIIEERRPRNYLPRPQAHPGLPREDSVLPLKRGLSRH